MNEKGSTNSKQTKNEKKKKGKQKLVVPLISILFGHIHEYFRQNPNKQYKYCLNHMDIPWYQLGKKLI